MLGLTRRSLCNHKSPSPVPGQSAKSCTDSPVLYCTAAVIIDVIVDAVEVARPVHRQSREDWTAASARGVAGIAALAWAADSNRRTLLDSTRLPRRALLHKHGRCKATDLSPVILRAASPLLMGGSRLSVLSAYVCCGKQLSTCSDLST